MQRHDTGGCLGVAGVCCAHWGQHKKDVDWQAGPDPAGHVYWARGWNFGEGGDEGHYSVSGWK